MRRFVVLAVASLLSVGILRADPPKRPNLFAKRNLVAWCIVPFDAKKRSPAQRAEMLVRLGLRRVAYDWRTEHVPSFEEEILQYKKHGLEYFAFWSWHPKMEPLIRKHGIHPQIWKTNPSPKGDTQQTKVELAAKSLLPLVEQTRKLDCKLGLYNHGGWGGEPENLVAVCEYLRREHKAGHVGIVYNFHHGHDHIEHFPQALKRMLPYLLCVNLNGMNTSGNPKIVPLGQGKHEAKMMKELRASGYSGAVGILDHRNELDAEKSLRLNLDGLAKIAKSPERRGECGRME